MLRRLTYLIEDYFGISPKEARGALLLLIASFILLWTPLLSRKWVFPLLFEEKATMNPIRLDSLSAELATREPLPRTPWKEPGQRASQTKRPSRLFSFDPNKATREELEELGIPVFLARRIENYRSKGGKFRKKEDLLHIYDFPAALYQHLNPYISLSQNTEKIAASLQNQAPNDHPATRQNAKTSSQAIVVFDINTADTTQLIRLRGIGSKLSLRIIKFRDALGGFFSTDQYPEVFGLDSLALSELQRYTRIASPVTRLALNTATAEQLSRHPYLRNRRHVQAIVSYREQHGPYQSGEDLKKLKILDEKTLSRLAPYLTFETN